MKGDALFIAAIGVAQSLVSDRCCRAVSRKHDRGIGQVKKFLPDSCHKEVLASSRKVGPTNASLEQYVASKDEGLGGV